MAKSLSDHAGEDLKQFAEARAMRMILFYGVISVMILLVSLVFAEEWWVILIGILASFACFFYGTGKARREAMLFYTYGELLEKVKTIDDRLGTYFDSCEKEGNLK